MKVLALTWFGHRRTTELCAGLAVELLEITTPRRGLSRYLILTVRTLRELARRRPAVLLVQNPSLVLAVLALILRRACGYRLLVDAHNEAVEPYINQARWVRVLSHWLLKHADLTIVTNAPLAKVVTRVGGRPFVLPDRVPTPPAVAPAQLAGRCNLVLIATFAPDEPVAAVFAAVRGLDVRLSVTGNHRKLDEAVRCGVPDNVTFTGFLSEDDYWSLLLGADAVIDLTTMDNCLVCGAYEAVAAGKPMLLTRSEASVELFSPCALFTDNTTADIREHIQELQVSAAARREQVVAARVTMSRRWDESARQLRALIAAGDLRSSAAADGASLHGQQEQ